MPVPDTDVHPKVKCSSPHYGCFNRVILERSGYYAPDRIHTVNGWYSDTKVYVENKMSKECRYDKSLSDKRCEGCKHRGSGEAYDAMIRSMSESK